jgi:hypothetical protein
MFQWFRGYSQTLHFIHLFRYVYNIFRPYMAILKYILCCKLFHCINSLSKEAPIEIK